MRIGVFDPAVRAAMKQRSRDRDAEAIARGEISPREMQRQNGIGRIMQGAKFHTRLMSGKPLVLRDPSDPEE